MPELRKDPLKDTWTIIATERIKRPKDFVLPEKIKASGTCPFCPGNETMTPPEVFAYREGGRADGPGWKVRAVPNKYPALAPGRLDSSTLNGVYVKLTGAGVHEVLIESPDHNSTLGTHPPEQMELVVRALRERLRALSERSGIRYVQVFKNWGPTAGASLEHTHFQIIAMPLVPEAVASELINLKSHGDDRGDCLLCELTRLERDSERLVEASDNFTVYTPFASRFPYEMMLCPNDHMSDFRKLPEDMVPELAAILRRAIRRVELLFDGPPYNLMLHTAPYGEDTDDEYYHWHMEIVTRLTVLAGFEFGTGAYINPTSPESAAEALRAIQPDGHQA